MTDDKEHHIDGKKDINSKMLVFDNTGMKPRRIDAPVILSLNTEQLDLIIAALEQFRVTYYDSCSKELPSEILTAQRNREFLDRLISDLRLEMKKRIEY